MKFQSKIMLLIVLLIACVVGGTSTLLYYKASVALEESLLGNMNGEAVALTASTRNLARQIMRDAQRTANRPDVKAFFRESPPPEATVAATSKTLAEVCDTYPDILRISILDENGQTVASSVPSTIGTNFKTRPYFQNAFAGDVFLAPPFKSAITNRGVIIGSAPISVDGKTRGVLVCTVSLDGFYQDFIKPIKIGERGFGYVLNASGAIVAHKDASMVFAENLPDAPLHKQIVAAKNGDMEVTDSNGVRVRLLFKTEPLAGMILVMQADTDDVFSALHSMRNTSLLISIIALAAGALVAFLAARAMVIPLREATGYAQAVARGDFSSSIEARSKDEVGTLVSALNHMVLQLKERLGFAQGILHGIASPFAVVGVDGRFTFLNEQMVRYWGLQGAPEDYYGKGAAEVMNNNPKDPTPLDMVIRDRKPIHDMPLSRPNRKGHKLSMRVTCAPIWDMDGNLLGACLLLADETEIREQQSRILALNERITMSVKDAHDISQRQGQAFEQLKIQLGKTSDAALAQEAASNETMSNIAAMSATLEALAEKAKQTTEDTRATRREAEDGNKIVGETVDCINKVAEFAGKTEKGMQELGTQAASITNIVELIKDVADQTNLLALNAAIEAARAGEAGRGFAVVADEVRKLAEKTMQATTEVNASISALQNEVAQNLSLTHETVELTHASTALAEKSGSSLSRIVTIAEHAVGEVLAISERTAEESRTGAAIAGAMQNITGMARESAQYMRESSEFVEQLARLSEELKRLVDSMGNDRRRADRMLLDWPYQVFLAGLPGGARQCRLIDISLTGMRIQVSGGIKDVEWRNVALTLTADQPPLADLLNDMAVRIVWADGMLAGIEFDQALSCNEDQLKRTIEETYASWRK